MQLPSGKHLPILSPQPGSVPSLTDDLGHLAGKS